jgi:hypothetical protein
MRRIALLATVLCAALAAPSGAWVETARYDVPGGGLADCLRAAGPGQLALLEPTLHASMPMALLDVGAGTDPPAVTASTTLGPLDDCPYVATTAGAPSLLVATVDDSHGHRTGTTLRAATPGAAPATIARTAGFVLGVSAAAAPSGAAVVAWTEVRLGDFTRLHLLAATRPPGQTRFDPATTLDDDMSTDTTPATGIDDAGEATVAWLHSLQGRSGGDLVRVADAPSGGRFAPPQTAGSALGRNVALVVTPQGRALLAADGLRSLQAYERLPGAPRFARVPLPPTGSSGELATAMSPDGGAVIGYRSDRSVRALVRPAGGAFRDGGTIQPMAAPRSGAAFVSFASARARAPSDGEGGRLTAALQPDGDALLTWADDALDGDGPSAHVARGTLADGFGAPTRLGSPCRMAAAARPLLLPDGTLGVAWSDDARGVVLGDGTRARSRGSVHVALQARPPGIAQPLHLPAAPRLSARLVGPPVLGTAQPLRIRIRCAAACDVRAGATARSVPQPHWGFSSNSGGSPLALGASTELAARESAVLTLDPIDGFNVAGVHGRPRSPIVLLACTPGGPAAQRVQLAPPRIRAPRPAPRVVDLVARLEGRRMRVTWRTTVPAHATRFILYAIGRRGDTVARATFAGRGRVRFARLLRPDAGKRVDHVVLFMQTPEIVLGAIFHARTR